MDTANDKRVIDERTLELLNRADKLITKVDRIMIFVKVFFLACAGVVIYGAIAGSWSILSGYRHGWSNPSWKLGVIKLYVAVVSLLAAGSVRFKWRFGVFSDWPERLLRKEQTELDVLNQSGLEQGDEKYIRGEVLKIKNTCYARIKMFGTMFLFLMGMEAICWFIDYERNKLGFYACWGIMYLVFIAVSLGDMRLKLAARDPERYKVAKSGFAVGKVCVVLWRGFLVLLGCAGLFVALLGVWGLFHGDPVREAIGLIGVGAVQVLLTVFLLWATAWRAKSRGW